MEPKNSANRMCSNTNPSISLLVFIRFRQTNYQKIALVALYKVMQTQHLCHPNPRITIAKSNAKISHLACAPIQILEYLPEYPLDWHEQNTKRKPSTRSTKTYQHHIHAIQTHVSALTMHPKNSAHLRWPTTNPWISLWVFTWFQRMRHQKEALDEIYEHTTAWHHCHSNPWITIAKYSTSHMAESKPCFPSLNAYFQRITIYSVSI